MSKGDDIDYPSVLGSMMMWSHYGDGFKGFCLEFDAEKLINSLRGNGSKIATIDVKYSSNDLPVINLVDYYNDIINETSDSSKEILRALSTKSNCWSYEKEFRIISDQGLHTYDISSINAIYIPEKTPIPIVEKIINFISSSRSKIKVIRVTLNKYSYMFGFTIIN